MVMITETFEEYYKLVRQRNLETSEKGHCPVFGVFGYSEEFLESKKDELRKFWEYGMNPYKALTFINWD